MPKVQKRSTLARTKGFIQGQLENLARKQAVEAPIQSNVSNQTIQDVEKAKRLLTVMADK